MSINVHTCETSTYDLNSDIDWAEHYPRLLSLARRFVYRYRLPCWRGQEEDLAEDVAQETVRRTIERIHKAALGEATPLDSVQQMMVVIARNYVLDLRRHDHRVVRISSLDDTHELGIDVNDLENTSETATEHIYHEWLFIQVARQIVHLPCKQRRAILIDLANRTSFNTQPTPLQAALLAVGIDLQDYQPLLPENPVERTRHVSLVSLAYKRIAHFPCTPQPYPAA